MAKTSEAKGALLSFAGLIAILVRVFYHRATHETLSPLTGWLLLGFGFLILFVGLYDLGGLPPKSFHHRD
jgi:hypothetical protein